MKPTLGDPKVIAEAVAASLLGPESPSGQEQTRFLMPAPEAPPVKRGRRILGIKGAKAAKRFRRYWRATFVETEPPQPTEGGPLA